MVWNHRVVHRVLVHGEHREDSYGIHEVYYEKQQHGARTIHKPYLCTINPVDPHGETMEELRQSLDMMRRALDAPVLEYDSIKDWTEKPNTDATWRGHEPHDPEDE